MATQTIETIIETGWHHLSTVWAGSTPLRLQCWCSAALDYPATLAEKSHFLKEHAECAPNEEWLMQQRSTR